MQYDRQFDPSRANALSGYPVDSNQTALEVTATVPQSPMGKACDSFSRRMEQLEVIVSELERKFSPVLRAVPPSPEGQMGAKEGNISSVTAMVTAWDARTNDITRRLSQLVDRCDL